jgi:hypothetical protein
MHCNLCAKRMFGKTRHNNAYYTCQPQLDRVGNPQEYADHPRAIYVREDRVLECVQKFFAQRVLGPDRAVWTTPGSLEAASPVKDDQRGSTEEVPGRSAGTRSGDGA